MSTYVRNPNHSTVGLYINNLKEYITEEMLWNFLHKKADIKYLRLPRDHFTKQSKGYAFIELEDLSKAKEIKEQFNYEKLLGSSLHFSLIISKERLNTNANLVIENVDPNVSPKAFENFFSTRWGYVNCSKLGQTPNGENDGTGYVNFENEDDANRCLVDISAGGVQLEGKELKAQIFSQVRRENTHNKNLYFKDYTKSYTEEQMHDAQFVRQEQERIQSELVALLEPHGQISSICVRFSPTFRQPMAFACFKEAEAAKKALESVKSLSDFFFAYCDWSKTKSQLAADRENLRDRHYIFMKNLKREVTEQQLTEAITKHLGVNFVKSAKIRRPVSSNFTTNYATLIIDDASKFQSLKDYAKEPGSELSLLFEPANKAFVSQLHPKKFHREHVMNRYWGNILGNTQNAAPSGPRHTGYGQLAPAFSPFAVQNYGSHQVFAPYQEPPGFGRPNFFYQQQQRHHQQQHHPQLQYQQIYQQPFAQPNNFVFPQQAAPFGYGIPPQYSINAPPPGNFGAPPIGLSPGYEGAAPPPGQFPQFGAQQFQGGQNNFTQPQYSNRRVFHSLQTPHQQHHNQNQQPPHYQQRQWQGQQWQGNQQNQRRPQQYQQQNRGGQQFQPWGHNQQQQQQQFPGQQPPQQQNIGGVPIQQRAQKPIGGVPVTQQPRAVPVSAVPKLVSQQPQLIGQAPPLFDWNNLETIKSNKEAFKKLTDEIQRSHLGKLILVQVQKALEKDQVNLALAPKITGMLIDFDVFNLDEIIEMLEVPDSLKENLETAIGMLQE